MPRSRRDVPPTEVNRLTGIRTEASRIAAKAEVTRELTVLADMPDPGADILGAIAWAGTVLTPTHPLVMRLVDQALASRMEWREVATAFGIDPEDEAAVANVAQTHRRRRATLRP